MALIESPRLTIGGAVVEACFGVATILEARFGVAISFFAANLGAALGAFGGERAGDLEAARRDVDDVRGGMPSSERCDHRQSVNIYKRKKR